MSTEVGEVKDWLSELSGYAQEDKSREKVPAGTPLKVSAGQFIYQDEKIGDNITAVVVDYCFTNTWYEDDYNPDDVAPPECFAIAASEDELAPHENAAKAQHNKCLGCEKNKFGTAKRGKGKACQNRRYLAVMPYNPDKPDAETADPAFLKLAPTSVKNWSTYVNKVATAYNRPIFGVITKITLDLKGTYSVAEFECLGLINDNNVLDKIMHLREEVNPVLYKPYEKVDEEGAKY